MPAWIDIVVKLTPAFVTLVIGVVAAGIAFLQYRIARDKLRLDLFSKRLEAYEKLQEFFTSVLRTATVEDSALPMLAEARYKSRFLFGPEIAANFDTLWKKAVGMRTLRSRLYGPGALPVGPERTSVCEEDHVLLTWMMEEMEDAPNRYSKYLHFK
jgi:hypothetical protein